MSCVQLNLQLGYARRRGLLPISGGMHLAETVWALGLLVTASPAPMAELSDAGCIWVLLPLFNILNFTVFQAEDELCAPTQTDRGAGIMRLARRHDHP